jgi:hypothetical protein
LDLEFTFPIGSSNIESEFPSKPLGAGNFTDTAMLIPLTTDFHFATLPNVEDAAIISTMVFCGVHESPNTLYVVDYK